LILFFALTFGNVQRNKGNTCGTFHAPETCVNPCVWADSHCNPPGGNPVQQPESGTTTGNQQGQQPGSIPPGKCVCAGYKDNFSENSCARQPCCLLGGYLNDPNPPRGSQGGQGHLANQGSQESPEDADVYCRKFDGNEAACKSAKNNENQNHCTYSAQEKAGACPGGFQPPCPQGHGMVPHEAGNNLGTPPPAESITEVDCAEAYNWPTPIPDACIYYQVDCHPCYDPSCQCYPNWLNLYTTTTPPPWDFGFAWWIVVLALGAMAVMLVVWITEYFFGIGFYSDGKGILNCCKKEQPPIIIPKAGGIELAAIGRKLEPGRYKILAKNGLWVLGAVDDLEDVVTTFGCGKFVDIAEIRNINGTYRGRLGTGEGWITMKNGITGDYYVVEDHGFKAGFYEISSQVGLWLTIRKATNSKVVRTLPKGEVCKVKEIAVVGDFVRGLLADDSGWIGLRNLGSRVDYVKVSSEESGDGKVHVVITGEGEGPAKQSGDADSMFMM